MAELLFELLSEEIPARMQKRAAEDLRRLVTEGLKAVGLPFEKAEAHVTPRRLALVADGIPTMREGAGEERRGPNVKAPERARAGFLNALPEGSRVEERETAKGTFFFAVVERKGGATSNVLPSILTEVVDKLPWPKSMRWGSGRMRWVRPLRSVIALFDGEVLAVDLDGRGHDIPVGDRTTGHRFLAPKPFAVADFADYKQKLFQAKTVLDAAERRVRILRRARTLAEEAGLSLNEDEGLADEVTGLVEWPTPLMGAIDPGFMELPEEVLTAVVKTHQKYFVCRKGDGSLADRFIVVSNMETADGGGTVVAGNERVLRARLSDAGFHWDADRAATLESRVPKLADIVFHAGLGTMDRKVERVRSLAVSLSEATGAAGREADRAALLCKADLGTGMVHEFPELQGVMGRYYASNDGEADAVADAVAEHYSPLGPGDACPTKPVSVAVALADKIDTLVGFWAIGEKPTGSKDPFALRRAALGVVRLITENGLRVPLSKVFSDAYGKIEDLCGRDAIGAPVEDVVPSILSFFADRLKVFLKGGGVRRDAIDAVLALDGDDDLVRLLARVEALTDFLDSGDGANLLTAYKRAANILRVEEKRDGKSYDEAPDPNVLTDDAERKLFGVLDIAVANIGAAVEDEDFEKAMGFLARLRGPVDTFFEDVTVNADDPILRENRLKLLNLIRKALSGVADFSKIEG